MADLYDTGANLASADENKALGGGGSGDMEPDSPAGMDTDGITLNYSQNIGLDPLTTGDFINTDYTLHQKETVSHLKKITSHLEKIAYNKVGYVRALPIRSATGIFRASLGTLAGWSVRETGGAATYVDLFDSLDGSNLLYIASISLAANGSDKIWLLPEGISFQQGLYIKITTAGAGAVAGALYIADKG